jgi:V-type H+-transporting ATPase subunit a
VLHQATRQNDCVFAFGVDSIWKVSDNQMQFVNSLKMKISVIIGVTHMMLGLLVRFINGFKRKDIVDIVTLTIPQTIFMLTTFVYMDYLIVFKWLTIYPDTREAPSIIATMIAVYARFSSEGDKLFWPQERPF